jgi:hypothetical protein
MKLPELISAVGEGFVLTVADGGAIGGLHPMWRSLRPIVSGALFDPRETAAPGEPAIPARDVIRSAPQKDAVVRTLTKVRWQRFGIGSLGHTANYAGRKL